MTNRRETNLLYVAYLVNFLDILGASLVVPLLPHVARDLGASQSTTALVNQTIYGALQLVGSPLMGRVSDRKGRKAVMIVSCLGTAVSYVIFGFADSIFMLALSRIPVGLLKQSMTISQAFVSDLTTPEERGAAIAHLNMSIALGFIVGPALGGWLSNQGLGVAPPAVAAVTVFLVLALIVHLYYPDSVAEEGEGATSKSKPTHPSALEILRAIPWRSTVGALLLARLLSNFGVNCFRGTFSIMTKDDLGLDKQQTGFLLSYLGALGVVTQAVGVRTFLKFFSESNCLQLSAVFCGVSLFLSCVSSTWMELCVYLIPMSLGSGVLRTLLISAISREADESRVGETLGYVGSVDSVLRIVSPTVGGFLLEWYGSWAVGLFSSFMTLAMVPVWRMSQYTGEGKTVEVDSKKTK